MRNQAWEQALRDLWFFEVSDARTIIEPEGQEPKIRRDVYDSIWCGDSPDGLICEVDQYDELRSHFQQLAADELEDVEGLLEDEAVIGSKRKRLQALSAALQDEDEGWQDWVRLEGKQGLPRFQQEIDRWLAEPIDWSWSEFWPQGWSSHGAALSFFRQLDSDVADALGVVLIEGEHPGSSYYAAELHIPISEANDVAHQLGLPFRFREERV